MAGYDKRVWQKIEQPEIPEAIPSELPAEDQDYFDPAEQRAVERRRVHPYDPKHELEGRARIPVERDAEGNVIRVWVPISVLSEKTGMVPEEQQGRQSIPIEKPKTKAPRTLAAWEHMFPQGSGDYIDVLPRELLNIGRTLGGEEFQSQNFSGWYTNPMSRRKGLHWFDPDVMPESTKDFDPIEGYPWKGDEKGAPQRGEAPARDATPTNTGEDVSINPKALDAALNDLGRAWVNHDPNLQGTYADFVQNSVHTKLQPFVESMMRTFLVRAQVDDADEKIANVKDEIFNEILKEVANTVSLGRYDKSSNIPRGVYLMNRLKWVAQHIGGEIIAEMTGTDELNTEPPQPQSEEQEVVKRNEAYANLEYDLGDTTPDFFAELNSGFKKFLVSQQADIPSNLKGSMLTSDLFQALLQNVDLQNTDIVPTLCPKCKQDSMQFSKTSAWCANGCTFDNGKQQTEARTVRKQTTNPIYAVLPVYLQQQRRNWLDELKRLREKLPLLMHGPSIKGLDPQQVQQTRDRIIDRIEELGLWTKHVNTLAYNLRINTAGDEVSGVLNETTGKMEGASKSPNRPLTFTPVGGGRGMWFPSGDSFGKPAMKQYAYGIDPEKLITGPGMASTFGMGESLAIPHGSEKLYKRQQQALVPILAMSPLLQGGLEGAELPSRLNDKKKPFAVTIKNKLQQSFERQVQFLQGLPKLLTSIGLQPSSDAVGSLADVEAMTVSSPGKKPRPISSVFSLKPLVEKVMKDVGLTAATDEEYAEIEAQVRQALDTFLSEPDDGQNALAQDMTDLPPEVLQAIEEEGRLDPRIIPAIEQVIATRFGTQQAAVRSGVIEDLAELAGGQKGFGNEGLQQVLSEVSQKWGTQVPPPAIKDAIEAAATIAYDYFFGDRGLIAATPNPGVVVDEAIRYFVPEPIKEAFLLWGLTPGNRDLLKNKELNISGQNQTEEEARGGAFIKQPLHRAAEFVVKAMGANGAILEHAKGGQNFDQVLQDVTSDPQMQALFSEYPEVAANPNLIGPMVEEAMAQFGPTWRAADFLGDQVAFKGGMPRILDLATRYARRKKTFEKFAGLKPAEGVRSGNGEYRIVLFANDDDTRTKGLMFTDPLADDECALFIFRQQSDHGFWNKNVSYPLTLAFCDANGRVVAKRHMEADSVEGCRPGRTDVKFVIEARRGALDDVAEGDRLIVGGNGTSLRFARG